MAGCDGKPLSPVPVLAIEIEKVLRDLESISVMMGIRNQPIPLIESSNPARVSVAIFDAVKNRHEIKLWVDSKKTLIVQTVAMNDFENPGRYMVWNEISKKTWMLFTSTNVRFHPDQLTFRLDTQRTPPIKNENRYRRLESSCCATPMPRSLLMGFLNCSTTVSGFSQTFERTQSSFEATRRKLREWKSWSRCSTGRDRSGSRNRQSVISIRS